MSIYLWKVFAAAAVVVVHAFSGKQSKSNTKLFLLLSLSQSSYIASFACAFNTHIFKETAAATTLSNRITKSDAAICCCGRSNRPERRETHDVDVGGESLGSSIISIIIIIIKSQRLGQSY